jgi:hypothetical protein
VIVYISKRAARAAERIDARWREVGDYPGTFAREFLDAIEFLRSVENPGSPFPTQRRPALKRMLLPKSRCHLYFEVDRQRQSIRVLHVWDGRRKAAPKL